jgi:hypothetical protein
MFKYSLQSALVWTLCALPACSSDATGNTYGSGTTAASGPQTTTDTATATSAAAAGTGGAGTTTGAAEVTSTGITGTTGNATTTGTTAVGTASTGVTDGTTSMGATTGAATTGNGTGTTGTGIDPEPIDYDLDCGDNSIVLEAHGPPDNRINYIIVGDGYTTADLESTYVEHLASRMEGDEDSPGRFDPALEPYRTYRNFVNICALKIASPQSGIPEGSPSGNGQGCNTGSAFDGCGNDSTRLGFINNQKVYAAVEANLPSSIEMDWVAVMLNSSEWWNSGGIPMVWSGGHPDASLAAQHEGGHGFFRLGDEYGNCGGNRVNVVPSDWEHWMGTVQDVHADVDGDQGTGLQDIYTCDAGSGTKPTEDSVMNSLWRSSYLNSISLENAVRSIYEIIQPIDSATDAATTAPGVLEVRVIDPAVVRVDWSIDGGDVVASGSTFDVSAQNLVAGSHTITARAWDPTPWVPLDTPHGRDDLEQTVQWTISVP